MALNPPFGTFFLVKTQIGDDRNQDDFHQIKLFGITRSVAVGYVKDELLTVPLRARAEISCDVSVKIFINDNPMPTTTKDKALGVITVVEVEFDFHRVMDVSGEVARTIYDPNQAITTDVTWCRLTDIADADLLCLGTCLYKADYSKNCRFYYLPDPAGAYRFVRCHSDILQASSSFFRTMALSRSGCCISENNARDFADDQWIEFIVKNVPFEGLELAIKFLYGQLEPQVIFNNKKDLLLIDQKLQIRDLSRNCMDFFRFDISTLNVLERLTFAFEGRSEELQYMCLEFLSLKFREVEGFVQYYSDAGPPLKSLLRSYFQANVEVLALIPG